MPRNKIQPNPIALHWRDHDGTYKRVWRSDWSGDQFEIVGPSDFEQIKNVAGWFSIPLIEAGEDD